MLSKNGALVFMINAESVIYIATNLVWVALLVSSVMAFAVIIDRIIYMAKINKNESLFLDELIVFIKEGDIKSSLLMCKTNNSPLFKIIASGLKNTLESKEYMSNEANKEIPKLERFISVLSTISTIAPLLGLLGTILGMIEAFGVIAKDGGGDTLALANGIANALFTTAAGLIIAIPCVVSYNYFVHKINKKIAFMESVASEVSDFLSK